MWHEQLLLEAVQEQPRPGAHHRVRGHQLRMREPLVDVLVDDVRLVQHEVALDQHRNLVVRIHHRQVLGLVVEVDVDDLEVHPLLVQHDAAALAEGVGGAGVEGHHEWGLLARKRRGRLRRPERVSVQSGETGQSDAPAPR